MKLTYILAVMFLICVGELRALWSRSSSSRSSSSSSRSSSSSSRSQPVSTNMNKNELTNLYNTPVKKVESYSIPLGGALESLGKRGVQHTGVVATTQDGDRYLIHKGLFFGKASSTVITDAKHMSSEWKKTASKETSGQTISDMMKHGLVNKWYGPGALCWDSTKNIMDKAGRRKRSC